MKPLTPQQVEGFVRMVGLTRDHELDCGECLRHVAEFAENKIAGQPLNEALTSVEHHLSVCPECREDYLALERLLRGSQ